MSPEAVSLHPIVPIQKYHCSQTAVTFFQLSLPQDSLYIKCPHLEEHCSFLPIIALKEGKKSHAFWRFCFSHALQCGAERSLALLSSSLHALSLVCVANYNRRRRNCSRVLHAGSQPRRLVARTTERQLLNVHNIQAINDVVRHPPNGLAA